MTRAMMIGMVAAVFAAGCADEAGPAQAPVNGPPLTDMSAVSSGPGTVHFVLRIPGSSVDVKVDARSITGPEFNLTRYSDASDHAIRGDAVHMAVNLDVKPEGVSGLFGGAPFDVKTVVTGEQMQVTGTVGGRPSAFAIDPRGVTGNVGRCMIQMARHGAEYVGTRGCGRGSGPASMAVPASFGAWSANEIGAALAILLSAGA